MLWKIHGMIIFSVSVNKSVCMCNCKKWPGQKFSKFYVFVKCLKKWAKTILAEELKTSVYQPESSFPKCFSNYYFLTVVLWFLARKLHLVSAKKEINLRVSIVHPEKCFGKSKKLEVFWAFTEICFVWQSQIDPEQSTGLYLEKLTAAKFITLSNSSLLFKQKIISLRSQNQVLLVLRITIGEKVFEKVFFDKHLLTAGCKNFAGFVGKDLNFPRRQTYWLEGNTKKSSKKLFSGLCYQTDSYKFKTTYKRARNLNAETGKLILLSKFQQSFINKFSQSCVPGVQWSFFRKKILGVFQDSERNLSWWCFQTSCCKALNAHLRRSFFGQFFRSKSCDFKTEFLAGVIRSDINFTCQQILQKKVVCNFQENTKLGDGVQI